MGDEARRRRALVLGGTGSVGRQVLRELARRDVSTTFSHHTSTKRRAASPASSTCIRCSWI